MSVGYYIYEGKKVQFQQPRRPTGAPRKKTFRGVEEIIYHWLDLQDHLVFLQSFEQCWQQQSWCDRKVNMLSDIRERLDRAMNEKERLMKLMQTAVNSPRVSLEHSRQLCMILNNYAMH
ncbi:hypothetical protein TRVA0_024S00562 [Trichomonascus vanleenenianus]|uniref:uncharacterized protein n=1 Tax=Trichomonascus vanleenenianus TaxID=2268995 RepID=UPI003ECA223D